MLKLESEFHTLEQYTRFHEEPGAPLLLDLSGEEFAWSAAVQEIKGITWDLDGPELDPWQAAQRLYRAGFRDAVTLATFWAVLEAESGGYLRAWHHNVLRNADGSIWLSEDNLMLVRSTDLGFIQRNVRHGGEGEFLPITGEQSQAFVDALFEAFPRLANGQESAEIAWELFQDRGYQPWYAFSNGSYKRSLYRAGLAVGNYLDMRLNGGNGHQLIRRKT